LRPPYFKPSASETVFRDALLHFTVLLDRVTDWVVGRRPKRAHALAWGSWKDVVYGEATTQLYPNISTGCAAADADAAKRHASGSSIVSGPWTGLIVTAVLQQCCWHTRGFSSSASEPARQFVSTTLETGD
jgi:hypothetical protein